MVKNGNREEQSLLIDQKVSIFDGVPTAYGTVKGFTDTEVIVRLSASKSIKIDPLKTEITLQFFQQDHGIMYDTGMDLSTSFSEDLVKNKKAPKKPSKPFKEAVEPKPQVKEEKPVEDKSEPIKKPSLPPKQKKFSLNLNEPEKEEVKPQEPPKEESPKRKRFSFTKQKVGE